MLIFTVPFWFQVVPSVELYPVKVEPERTSLSQLGTVRLLPATLNVVLPLVALRELKMLPPAVPPTTGRSAM